MKRLLRGWRLNSFFTATKAYSWAMGQEYLRPKTTKPAKYKQNMRCISSKQLAGVLHRCHLTPNIVSAPQFQGLDVAHAIFGLAAKSEDPSAPLELRIDISPSEEFGEPEKLYVGQSDGHSFGLVLIVGTIISIPWVIGYWGWQPSAAVFLIGVFIILLTKTPGDAQKILEVREAKKRIRYKAKCKLQDAMQDVRAWAELDGVSFEKAVARIYLENNYEVEFTPRTNDQGVDLILRKNGVVSIVQCKAYKKNVGVSAVRELVGVRAAWPGSTKAVLVALFSFSNPAKAFAIEHNVKLFSVAKDYLKTDYRPS